MTVWLSPGFVAVLLQEEKAVKKVREKVQKKTENFLHFLENREDNRQQRNEILLRPKAELIFPLMGSFFFLIFL